MSLVRVIADAEIVTDPTPIFLTDIDGIYGADQGVFPQGGLWVFIASIGSGHKFVRYDGISQQDVPFDNDIDIRSFTFSSDGAIDFLGFRIGTSEKIRGTIAAGETQVVINSAGFIDPAQIVVFTRIN